MERQPRNARPKRSLAGRLALGLGGVALAAAGIALLLTGSGGSDRLFRVDGILIVVGAILVVAGTLGW